MWSWCWGEMESALVAAIFWSPAAYTLLYILCLNKDVSTCQSTAPVGWIGAHSFCLTRPWEQDSHLVLYTYFLIFWKYLKGQMLLFCITDWSLLISNKGDAEINHFMLDSLLWDKKINTSDSSWFLILNFDFRFSLHWILLVTRHIYLTIGLTKQNSFPHYTPITKNDTLLIKHIQTAGEPCPSQ